MSGLLEENNFQPYSVSQTEQRTNCKNCGAVVDVLRSSCEFCDTYYFDRQSVNTQQNQSSVSLPCSGLFNFSQLSNYSTQCSG